jgi:chemotaxis protein MotB
MAPPPPPINQQPVIIIKRKRKGRHDAHHGGAWKVAYADFVTAMMAFFLLLWLLNVTTHEQRAGIADYFSPASVSRSTSGSGGVLGGLTITVPGAMISPGAPVSFAQPTPSRAGESEREANQTSEEQYDRAGMSTQQIEEKALREEMAKREQRQFDEAEKNLRQAIQSVPELAQLAESLMIEQTQEGLRIQILDQANYSMFPLGSSQMYSPTRQILGLVAQAVGRLPNKLSISGHTDGTRFARGDVYGNWELSTDRANASRRALIAGGISDDRFETVVGRADRDHLFPSDPQSPRNRRISIVLLREVKPPPRR